MKVLPFPMALWTRISPPSRRAISRLIERPRPVPPCLRGSWPPSACWNASKIRLSLSSGIPMPVSVTSKAIRVPPERAAPWRSGVVLDDPDAQLDLPRAP